jgi:NodT family efflux transporter outer membrane factor (OMF) lipoprotein
MNLRSFLFTGVSALLLAGCVDRGGWKPAPELQPQSLASSQTLKDATAEAAAWPADGWWKSYGDPQLDALVDEALAGSPSLEIAQARLRAAQGLLVSAHGVRAPQMAVDASVVRQRFPDNDLYPPPLGGSWNTQASALLNFNWDLDFWGHNRQLIAAARAGEAAAEADRQAARLAISVAVVQAYIQLDLNYALLKVTQDNLKQVQSILDLTQERVTAGLETTARVKQSEGTVALTRAGIAYLEASIELSRNQLADLVGAGPDRGRTLSRPQLNAPTQIMVPAALPADLLGRRPDVAAARAQVEAARRGMKAAEASFYPNINLTAFAGFESFGLSEWFSAPDRTLGAGPALSLPVFNRDALRGQLYGQQAQYDSSVGQYNQVLIDAVRQVADVIANWRGLEAETLQQQVALDAAQRSYDLTSERYRAGLDNYLSVLSSENQLLIAQGLGAELEARRLTFSVNLVQALGGGYTAPSG